METDHLNIATVTLSKLQIWVGKKEGVECTKPQKTDQKDSLTRQCQQCPFTQFLIYGNIITRKVNSRHKSAKEEERTQERGLGLCTPKALPHQPAKPQTSALPPAPAGRGPCPPAAGPPPKSLSGVQRH